MLSYHLSHGGHTVVYEAGDGSALEQGMIDREVDIVVIDRYLPGIDSLAYCRMLNALQPYIQILLLVAYEHEARALQATAFLAGAGGCLSKDLEPQAYLAAIHQLLEGYVLFHAEVMRRAARPPMLSGSAAQLQGLTGREREILELVAEGMSNREIARQLDISYHTAMKHVSNIIGKLKVSNRMEAGLVLLRHNESAMLLPERADD